MTPKIAKIFISYARADSKDLAFSIRDSLQALGLDPWLDTDRIKGGAIWTKAIEQELDRSDVVLALISKASYDSELCRAEQLRALRKGKLVVPVGVQQDAELPLHLEARHWCDFSNGYTTEQLWDALSASKTYPSHEPHYRKYSRPGTVEE